MEHDVLADVIACEHREHRSVALDADVRDRKKRSADGVSRYGRSTLPDRADRSPVVLGEPGDLRVHRVAAVDERTACVAEDESVDQRPIVVVRAHVGRQLDVILRAR